MCKKSSVTISFSFPKLGVPTPVIGSQPFVACAAHGRQSLLSAAQQGGYSTHVEAGGAAARVVADGNVVERGGVEGLDGVHERVQEPERGEALLEAGRVQERHNAGERRRGSGGASDRHRPSRKEDAEEVCLRGDIGDGLMWRVSMV